MSAGFSSTIIHPSAVIEKGAEIGQGVTIGPFSHIESHVKIGDGTQVASHVHIKGRTTIGKNNRIWSFGSIGCEPQDLKFRGEDTELFIGDDNMIREYANISIGTEGGGGKTVIGSGNLLMVHTHVAHDCLIGSRCIIANGVSLGGHVEIGDKAVLGGHSAYHQFTKIGFLAMIAGGSIVVQDVPPFCMVHGNHASANGLNLLGLKRANYSKDEIKQVKQMYKLVFQSNLTLDDAKSAIHQEFPANVLRELFVGFLNQSTRGICR